MQKIEPHLRSDCGLHVVACTFLGHRFAHHAAIAHGVLAIHEDNEKFAKITANAGPLTTECD